MQQIFVSRQSQIKIEKRQARIDAPCCSFAAHQRRV